MIDWNSWVLTGIGAAVVAWLMAWFMFRSMPDRALSGLRVTRARDKKLRAVGLQADRDLAYLNEVFEAGKFKPVIDSEFEFTDTDVRNAFHHFGAAAHKGKSVVRT
jgi:NADPH:quinone reductase-like Zn-dependent oxidoreductase